MNHKIENFCITLLFSGLIIGCSKPNKADAALDDLERTCDKSAAIFQKIKDGDNSAILEMQKLMADYQSLSTNLDAVNGPGFTPAQQLRYIAIIKKYQASLQKPQSTTVATSPAPTAASASPTAASAAAMVKKSEVSAALRTAGVMNVAADGSSAWAQQVTKLKSREDAMELLKKVIPEITRNLACGRIIQDGGKMVTEENKVTGDRQVKVVIEYDSNYDWWNKEAYPALDAALTALRLQDESPKIETYEIQKGPSAGFLHPPDVSHLEITRERDVSVDQSEWYRAHVRIYNFTNESRQSVTIKSFHLPLKFSDEIRELCKKTIEREQELFSLEFSGSDSKPLGTLNIDKTDKVLLSTLMCNYTDTTLNIDSLGITPFFSIVQNEYVSDNELLLFNQPFCVTYVINASDDILLKTKSLKLIPGKFGVIEKSLREKVAEPPVVAP